ncbi:MAG TPA: 50S ribosomal protein L15, partial [Candidatus Marinimicrobia bacterium]|nr:50S ribosomal protein L15 [Candidatus Neomarinimicrobiota bacterium]
FQIVNLRDIAKLEVNTVDASVMFDNGLIRSTLKPIKVLGDGQLDTVIDVTASAFSASAKDKIKKAGGSAIVL